MKHIFYLIAIALTMASCELIEAVAPVDWSYHPPAPVLPPDTCDELHSYSDPFIMFTTNKDVPGIPVQWLWNGGTAGWSVIPDIEDFLLTYGDSVDVYLSGINKCIVLIGYDNASYFSGRLFCVAGNGVKTNFGAYKRGMVPRGAMKFFEYWDHLQSKKSTRRFDMCNTGYTCDEITQVFQWWLDNCIDGTGVTFRVNCLPCDLTPLIEQIEARGATIQHT